MSLQRKRVEVSEYYAGDEVPLRFTVRDESGQVVDLSGGAVHWVLAKRPGGTALVDKPNGSGAAITDAANGLVTITLEAADTSALKQGRYHHELEVTLLGQTETSAWGPFRLYETSAN